MFTRLETIIVDKPWGRVDIPRDFGDFGDRRVGEIWFAHPVGDDAPIMVKFLFTSERLSIQVHPDDEAAAAASYPRGKEECRSEENTSELQSLMRISYAVFRLKKKKQTENNRKSSKNKNKTTHKHQYTPLTQRSDN